MASPTLVVFLLSIVLLVCHVAYKHSKKNRVTKGLKALPGPKGFPVIGSVPELPNQHPWVKFHEWGREYGPICQVNLMGDNHVWISSAKIADDLLAKRGAIYSQRSFIPAIGDDCRFSNHYVPLMSYGDDHRRIKSFMKDIMTSMPKDRLKRLAVEKSKTMILNVLADPSKFKQYCEECAAGISSTMAWNDSSLTAAQETVERANDLVSRISPDGDIQNKLPFLRYVPSWVPNVLKPWKYAEAARFNRERNFWFGEREQVQQAVVSGTAEPSWMERFLGSGKKALNKKHDEEYTYAVGMLALIGGVLVSSPIQTFFLAMTHFPEWQQKAQEEVDRVCGDRIPGPEDIQNLPTVRAVIRECFRWRSPAPVGVPHALERDDEYNGYHIPKDSYVFGLEWALTRDPELYPDPEAFNPSRWLDPAFPTYKEPLTHYPNLKGHSGFGWGRRVCVGQEHTEIVHITAISMLLWSVNILKKKDEQGREIQPPWFDYTAYVIVRPMWFPLDVQPRSEKRVQMLKQGAEELSFSEFKGVEKVFEGKKKMDSVEITLGAFLAADEKVALEEVTVSPRRSR